MFDLELRRVLFGYVGREYQPLFVLGAMAVCLFDNSYSSDEQTFVLGMCDQWNVAYSDISAFLKYDSKTVIAGTLAAARRWLNPNGRQSFLDVCILASRADDRLLFSEQLLLILVADALLIPKAILDSRYYEFTGKVFPPLGDPSAESFYQRRSDSSSARDQAEYNKSASNPEIEVLLSYFSLRPGCTLKDIKAAYRREALLKHPDRYPDDSDVMRARRSDEFIRIKQAYNRLVVLYG